MTVEERDRLERAVDELRAFARAVPTEAEATRRRVLDDGPVRWGRWVRGALVGLALVVFGGPALAQVTGRWPALMERVAGWAGASGGGRGAGTGTGTGVGTGTGAGTGTGVGTGTAAGTGTGTGIGVGTGTGTETGIETGDGNGVGSGTGVAARRRFAPPADVDRARALYLTAHRAHFGGTDSAVALRAWDQFLRAAPADPFAPEARYNRAILLVKLGRLAEAVEALAGFACAAPGSYRQREAAELIARARAMQPQLAAPACGGESP